MARVFLLLFCTWLAFFGKVLGQPLSLSACTDGFISQDLNTALQSSSLTVPYEQQRVIPGISFNCRGAITSWTIGAQWETGGSHDFFPHLQIWRSVTTCGLNAYVLVGDTELSLDSEAGLVSGMDYVFTGTPDPVLEFQAGDILGIFQPRESRSRVRVYYNTSTGPTNYYIDTGNANEPSLTSIVIGDVDGMEDGLPLVTIEIALTDLEVNDYELLNEAEVTTALQSTSLTIPYQQQRIIPDIPLNCSGTITFWTIGAEWRTDGMNDFFPHLQLWRSVDGCIYTLIGDTELFVEDSGGLETQNDYIFRGTPDPAVGFQTGDILGIYQPRESRSRVRVYYDTSAGPLNYYNDIALADEPPLIQDQANFSIVNANGIGNGLPLLAVEITIDCDPLTNPENGVVVTMAITTDSLRAVYSCTTGYELAGEEVRNCNCQNTGGMWTGVAPTCDLIDCGGLTDPEGGQVTFTPGVVATIETGLDAIANYSCNASDGYMLLLDSTRTCQDNGMWSGVAGICTRCDFSALTDPENGNLGITTVGGDITASYICDTGYQLVGDESITCQSTGEFSGQEPVCNVINCGGLTDPEGGQVTFTPGVVATIETGLDAMATYSCNVGYDLVGDEMRTCQSDGQWAGAEPTCMARSGICVLGSTEVTETSFLDSSGQHLDFGNPAACNGNLTAWHFCYYAADIDQPATYVVLFRVWRMSGGNSFDRIHNYQLNMAIDLPSNGQTLICENVTLSTPLDVQRNDILGVHVPSSSLLGGPPLHIVARDTTNFGLFFDTRSLLTPLNSMTISTDNLENRTTLGLHLYADIVINCGGLPSPEDGQVTFTPGVVVTTDTGLGAVAAYTCSEGYSLVGDAMRTCLETGEWNGAEPNCMLIDCGGLTDPEGGQVTFTPGVVVTIQTGLDAIATYTCSEGYDLVGGATRTCQETGQWNGASPNCILLDCGNLTDPESGQVTFAPGVVATIDTGLDAVAAYTCNQGYNLVGDVMRTCQADEQWTGVEPNCMLIDCGGLTDPEGGQVTFTPGVVATINTGLDAIATYTCNRGYDLVGDEMRTCQANGQWNGTEPNCILIDCGGLTDPEGGQVTFTPGVVTTIQTGLDAIATYTCSEGYDLVGGATRTCQETGQWNGASPNCILLDCGNLADPESGQVTFTPGVVVTIDTGSDAVAAYTCNQGYNLVGDVMRTCQADGQWNGTEPNCMLIDCGGLTDPEGGQVTFTPGVVATIDTALDAIATYTCSEGYDLVGDTVRTCQANTQWNGAEPICMLINCGNLSNPANGLVTITRGVVAETGVGALAMYTCSEGYQLIGNETRTCQDTGDWNQVAPTCMLINCGNLKDPENGTVTINSGVVPMAATGLDAVATYTCKDGFNLMGTATRTCQLNGEWDGVEPSCIVGPLPSSTQSLDQVPSQTPTLPPTDSTTTVASDTGPQAGSNIGLVAGAAAGIGILVIIVAGIILLLYRRRKRGIYKISEQLVPENKEQFEMTKNDAYTAVIATEWNEAYMTRTHPIPVARNEAYMTNTHSIPVARNEAYGVSQLEDGSTLNRDNTTGGEYCEVNQPFFDELSEQHTQHEDNVEHSYEYV